MKIIISKVTTSDYIISRNCEPNAEKAFVLRKGGIKKDREMTLILYLNSCPDIGSSTQFKVFHSGRPFPASGHVRLLLLPWSLLATQKCTGVNWSHKTFGQQQGDLHLTLLVLNLAQNWVFPFHMLPMVGDKDTCVLYDFKRHIISCVQGMA